MAKTVAVLRVSTDEQVASGLGLEAQRESCIQAARRLGRDVSLVCADAGVSGSAPLDRRPGLMAAIDTLAKGDILLVSKRDRLGRDVVLVGMIEQLVRRKGARVVSAAGEGSDDDGPTGELLRTIIDAFAQFERAMIRARTKSALAAKKARGERTGTVPFGFTAGKGGALAREEVEQQALSTIAGLRASGMSLRAIACELERLGVQPKRSSRWFPSSVRSVMRTAGLAA